MDGVTLCDENLIQLLEINVLGVLPEALTAHVQTVLADQIMSVGADVTSERALAVFAGPGVMHILEPHAEQIIQICFK